MKLNYKRTFFIGFAFLSISAFWQMYDNIIPLILQNPFTLTKRSLEQLWQWIMFSPYFCSRFSAFFPTGVIPVLGNVPHLLSGERLSQSFYDPAPRG